MTETLDTLRTALINAIREINDDVERYQAIKNLEFGIEADLKQEKASIANRLHEGRSWNQVGKLLGVTGSRAEQISRTAR